MTATPISPIQPHLGDAHIIKTINALVVAVNTLNGVQTPSLPADA